MNAFESRHHNLTNLVTTLKNMQQSVEEERNIMVKKKQNKKKQNVNFFHINIIHIE